MSHSADTVSLRTLNRKFCFTEAVKSTQSSLGLLIPIPPTAASNFCRMTRMLQFAQTETSTGKTDLAPVLVGILRTEFWQSPSARGWRVKHPQPTLLCQAALSRVVCAPHLAKYCTTCATDFYRRRRRTTTVVVHNGKSDCFLRFERWNAKNAAIGTTNVVIDSRKSDNK